MSIAPPCFLILLYRHSIKLSIVSISTICYTLNKYTKGGLKLSNIALENIYNNLNLLINDCRDLSDTEKAENNFWDYVKQNILEDSEPSMEFENALYSVAYYNQKQGFIYGFKYAIELLGK